ncbi:MAG: haloacid dehalogenase-like hydrolase [Opitutaceae bacterium]|nr:haloacid dehalogenase-like hydrolase [Opitutaceae bacterium]
MQKTILLLWDIDGTLIASGNAGMHALQRALRHTFAIDGSLADIDFAGRTDTWIMRAILRKFALPTTDDNLGRLFASYLSELPAALHNPRARVLPGAREIIAAAAGHGSIAQGLLTGNRREGARAKLAHHGLWDHFPFGAFGDDGELRNDLGPHALRRARETHGVDFPPQRTWIIGDTPHDIACGRAIGARTLAVATGGSTLDQLRAHDPDAALENLSDTARVLSLLTS